MIKLLSLTCWRRLAQGSFLALALQLFATGGAWAATACDVTLSSILPGNLAVLKADCATAVMSQIVWTKDASATPLATIDINPATAADLFLTVPLTDGTHSYKASGTAASGAGATTGKAAVLTFVMFAVTGAVTPSGSGSVTCNPSSVVMGGTTTCAITAASASYTLTGATGNPCGGSLSLGNTFTTGPVTSACTVTATFQTTYTVTGIVGSGVGTVNCSSPVTSGQITTCLISAGTNYTINGTPSGCGGNWSGNSTSGTFTTAAITNNCSVTANFSLSQSQGPYTVTTAMSPQGGGTSVTCSPNPVNAGSNTTCNAVAASGYTFTSFTGNCTNGNSSFNNAVIGPITSACTVTANFTSSTSGNCGAGEVFGQGDVNMPANLGAFPEHGQALPSSDSFGRAIRFVADATNWPNGIVLGIFDQTAEQLPKDFVISACPHNFTPVNNGSQNCQQIGVAFMGSVSLRYGAPKASYDCALTPGATYYLNFRSNNLGQFPNVSAQGNARPNSM
jgi:hypothetical protein